MLKFLIQDQYIHAVCNCQLLSTVYSETSEDDGHIPFCSCDVHMVMKRCCLQNQRPNTCLSPLPAYGKNKDCLSCQSVAVGYFNPVVNKGNPVPCSSHGCCMKQLQLCTHLFSTGQKNNKACRGRSPSPPPLSPVEADEYDYLEELVEGSLALDKRLEMNSKPPSLLPAEKACSVCEQKYKVCIKEVSGNLDETFQSANQVNSLINSNKLEKAENASAFQDLMDRINEKLKSIETTEMVNPTKLSKSDGRSDDIKLRSFITSLLHDAKVNDYNFMELLNQYDKEVENKIIQTRFRKRQETLFAMHNSPDSSLFRRQSLQIKRELASLDESFIRKKASSERITKKPTKSDKLSVNKIDNLMTLKDLALQNNENKESLFSQTNSHSSPIYQEASLELPLNNSETNFGFMKFSENNSASQANLAKLHGSCGVELCMDPVPVKADHDKITDRTKHNIIPPMWCSVYVTNNFLFQKSSKIKLPLCIEGDKMPKDFQPKTCSNEDINKIVRNTNLHVVVERLEDTINMAQKTKKTLFNGYKISSKLKDLHSCDAKTKSGLLINMNETGSKGQYVLSKGHEPFSNNSKKECVLKKDVSGEPYKSLLNSPNFESDVLISNHKDLQTKSDPSDNSPMLTYTSPIKLMFLSEINSSEGVKYTLTSVKESSKLNIDLFSAEGKASLLSENQLEGRDPAKNVSIDECLCSESTLKQDVNSVFPAIVANEANVDECKPKEHVDQSSNGSALKRKPGRPKKIGPQVVKQVKRPIGRPPKPKVDISENVSHMSESVSARKHASCNSEILKEDNINKNITVTVVFGRSRRTKRCVSEGSLNVGSVVPGAHSDCDAICESAQVRQSSEDKNDLPKIKSVHNSTRKEISGSGYEHVRPLESSPVLPSHCSNIIRPNQKPLNIVRKPGRPAKVKISGISVTVNQISSQERKVSINSCLPPLEQETVLEKNPSSNRDDKQCNKGVSKSFWNDASEDLSPEKVAVPSKKPEIPLRQSLRDRRPSLPFLHSLASSNPLSCRRAFLHKSYKLCLKSAKDQKIKNHSNLTSKHTSEKRNPENAKKYYENNAFKSISEMSSDPIISSNSSLRWWDPSISNDSLLQELNSRYDQITNTWLHVNGEEFGKCLYDNMEQDCSVKVSNPLDSCFLQLENSPIKMLFQKKCNIDELCTWFMQTTETQSLSLVRKANARNPFEVISTRQFKMGARQYDCNPSPLRKHFKKFALSTPSKSAGKLQMLHKIVRSRVLNRKRNFTLAKLQRTKFENLQHDRWRQIKKLYNHGTSDWKSKRRNLRFFCQSQCLTNTKRKIDSKMCMNQGNTAVEIQSPTILIESHRITSSTGNEIRDTLFQQKTQLSDLSTKPGLISNYRPSTQSEYCNQQKPEKAQSPGELGEGTWKGKTFKDCRIFLKKINPVEEQHSFNKNLAVCTPESIDHSTSQSYFQEKGHCTLRSHSAKQTVPDRCEKDAEPSKGGKHSSFVKGLHLEQNSKKSSKRVTFDDGPTEVPKKINKRRRTQCKLTDLDIRKKNKRRLCSAGQVSSCYSKYQLGPLKPVGLPLLGGFASRAVEYSMIPFHLPLHGSS